MAPSPDHRFLGTGPDAQARRLDAQGTIAAMLIHPAINPVALQLGPVAVHWYGLTYLAAFGLFMLLGKQRLGHAPFAGDSDWLFRDVEDVLFLGVLGVVLGGRFGYCLFYNPVYYAAHPLEILYAWRGGMSFHGGLLGVILAMALSLIHI